MMMMMMMTTSSTTTGTVTTTMRGCARRHGGGGGGRGRGVGAMPRRTGARGAIDDGGGGWRAPCRARALARGDDDGGDGGDASSSSYALDEMLVLKTLREAYDASSVEFASIVRRSRTALTLSFFSACEARGEALRARGAVEDAEALDAMCGAAYAMASYTLEEITEGLATSGAGALGAGASDAASDAASKQTSSSFSSSSSSSTTTTTGLTLAQENELRARWGELTKALATTGESNALAQGALNEESRKNAITEIAGRVSVGAGEMERLMRVAPERRIVDVLLTIPRGDERAAAVNDALTPPEDGDDVDGDEENEVVFTTAPKLLNVLEAMRRDARAAGDDATLVVELDELAAIVESKCEYS